MKFKLALATMLTSAVCAGGMFLPAAVSADTPPITVHCATSSCLTQTITGTTTAGDPVNLTATVTRFVNQRGHLFANVATTGTVGDQSVNQNSLVPVTSLQDPCTILDLTLGPLHLDLLGLVIDLNQVHLTITGDTGPGNLLGNLLCGVANALNGGGGGGIATLLNNLLGSLGGL